MAKKIIYSPFKTCVNGHDLSGDNPYLYDGTGKRTCRQCAMEANKKNKRTKGSFA